jgi:hypothetical protein
MRSSSWPELLTLALAAVAEGVWIGAAVGLVTSQSGPASMAFAAAVVFVAAAFARRASLGGGPSGVTRAVVVLLPLVAGGALFAVTRSWAGPHVAANAIAAVGYAALLVLAGIAFGREPVSPHDAVLRAVRGFALLCAVLVVAALAGHTPAWAAGAVVTVLLGGGLLVAAARYQALAATAPPSDRAPALRWLLAVVGVLLLVVAVGALLGLVLRVDVLLWVLAVVGDVLRFLLGLVAFGLGWAGAGVLRLLAWLLSLVHVHGLPTPKPPSAPAGQVLTPRRAPATGAWGVARVVLTVAAGVVAVGVPLLLVALALRRTRRGTAEDISEEREAIVTLRGAAGGAAARMGRRLRRLVPRRHSPATPAELVRRRYQDLERRLARAGHPRSPGETVRTFLQSLPGAPDAEGLAAVYELARYSDHTVDEALARRFEAQAATFGVATPAGAE